MAIKSGPLELLCKNRSQQKKPVEPLPSSAFCATPPLAPSLDNVGCIILAGGQGTRLGWSGPKGCMPLGPPQAPTLFSLLLQQIAAAKKEARVAIMTSPFNDKATRKYLEKSRFFGLDNVEFFIQDTMPLSDFKGRLVYSQPPNPRLIYAPAGNGRAFYHFCDAGIWASWKRAGIQVVQVIAVDNPLACPFDRELVGALQQESYDLVLRVVKRESKEEKIGIVGCRKTKLAIEEYSSRCALERGLREFPFGNTGIFSCAMDWLGTVYRQTLPWNLAEKTGVGHVWEAGKWKQVAKVFHFETFIFDLFSCANRFRCLVSDRRRFFAPIKTKSDVDKYKDLPEIKKHF